MQFQNNTKEKTKDKLSLTGKIILVLFLFTLSIWVFPAEGGFFGSLTPEDNNLTVTGLVKAAPYETPIPHATVYSDSELVLTDEQGFFHLASEKNSIINIEAKGYKRASIKIKDNTPLMFLLSPTAKRNNF